MYVENTTAVRRKKLRKTVLGLLAVALLAAGVWGTQAYIAQDLAHQSAAALKSTVLRAAVQCYAIEGAYPPDVAYLEQTYGLQINHERFYVTYDAFASNCLPNVQVLPRGAA